MTENEPRSKPESEAPEEGAGSSDRARSRRLGSKAILLVVIALAGALALVSATQVWVVVGFFDGAAATSTLQISGQQLNPSISPVAIAALASVLALTIAGKRFRVVLGGLVTLLGAGIVVLGFGPLLHPRAEAEWAIGEATGIIGDSQYELIQSVSVTTWPSVAIATGAILAIAGVCVIVFGLGWAAGGRKYEQTSAQLSDRHGQDQSQSISTAAGDSTEDSTSTDRDRISDWDTMSDGTDPTQNP